MTPSKPRLLDGPMGTELNRRGGDTTLPLWSARALIEQPELVRDIHYSFLEAGADILTTNTFRTQEYTLKHAGYGDDAKGLTELAVELAQHARDQYTKEGSGQDISIAGSIAPLEDCYSPHLVPSQEILEKEHTKMISWLVEVGVDILLVETMNTVREMEVVVSLAGQYDLPLWISFTTDNTGTILSGETWEEAIHQFHSRVDVIMVNCSSLEGTAESIAVLSSDHRIPAWGFYPNFGVVDDTTGWQAGRIDTDEFRQLMQEWMALQPSVIGTCCGATPTETKILRHLLDTS